MYLPMIALMAAFVFIGYVTSSESTGNQSSYDDVRR